MSNQLVEQVWNHAPYIGEKMLALLAIAEWANDEGYCAIFPDRLADRVRVTKACAVELLQEFIEDGTLRLILQGGRNDRPFFYQLLTESWHNDNSQQKATQITDVKWLRINHQ